MLGDVDMNEVATAPGQMLSIVYPYTTHVDFVSDVIQKVLNGEEVEQEEMPEGDYDDEFFQTFFGYNPNAEPEYEEPVYQEPQTYDEESQTNSEEPATEENAAEEPVQENNQTSEGDTSDQD